MSRIMLLMVVVLWMCRTVAPRRLFPLDTQDGAFLFVGGLMLVVLFLGLWSRTVANHLRGVNLHRSLKRFHNSIVIARFLIPVWFGIAVFLLGWGEVVDDLLKPLDRWPLELPGMLIGTFPAFAAWMALWWAQYPADRALREQTMHIAFDEGLPVHRPPGFWTYFIAHLRLQLLFTIVPIALIICIHDVASIVLLEFARMDLRSPAVGSPEAYAELVIQLVSIGLVVLFAPEVLRRVLHTQSLPASPLRSRLEALCERTGLAYRDILLWRTDNNMGNAAVMGVVPQMRYVLLSDVLLETMTDRQIEAVFAHEIGHVKHWHMGWYAVLIATLVLLCFGPGQLFGNVLDDLLKKTNFTRDFIAGAGVVAVIGGFFVVFGYISRWFERQADVFAARIIQQQEHAGVAIAYANTGDPTTAFEAHGWAKPAGPVERTYVGPHGAALFTAALHRVAVINNIPLSARNFTHGSIAERVKYLETLSTDPTRTVEFDRWMSILYAGLVFGLIVCFSWVMVVGLLGSVPHPSL